MEIKINMFVCVWVLCEYYKRGRRKVALSTRPSWRISWNENERWTIKCERNRNGMKWRNTMIKKNTLNCALQLRTFGFLYEQNQGIKWMKWKWNGCCGTGQMVFCKTGHRAYFMMGNIVRNYILSTMCWHDVACLRFCLHYSYYAISTSRMSLSCRHDIWSNVYVSSCIIASYLCVFALAKCAISVIVICVCV